MSRIRFRLSVCPIDDQNPTDTYWIDVEADEADIQAIDEPSGRAGLSHGFDDFVEKFMKPAIMLAVDRFQQNFDMADDLQQKMLRNGGLLPRGIEFFRQKNDMDKARRNAA